MVIRAMCRCGYPYEPDLAYGGHGPWTGRKPKRYCSARCARAFPAKDRAHERAQAKARARARAWEAAGQLTLW